MHRTKRKDQKLEVSMISDIISTSHDSPFNIKEEAFSSYNRLIRVTAWCLRFVTNIRRSEVKGVLSNDEINKAVNLWIRYTQRFVMH